VPQAHVFKNIVNKRFVFIIKVINIERVKLIQEKW
jgi:hypothetical protein